MESLKKRFLVDNIPYEMALCPIKKVEMGYISSSPLVSVRSESNGLDEEFYLDFDDGKIQTVKSLPSLSYDFLSNNALIPDTNLIQKDKYYFLYRDSMLSNIYIYKGKLEGLKVIEIEFEDEEQFKNFSVPLWFKSELDPAINDLALSYFNQEDLKSFVLTK